MMDDDEMRGASYLIQNVMNYRKIMKAVWRKECGSRDPKWVLGKSHAVNLDRIWKHMLKKQSMELIVGVVILPYNSKKNGPL